jgi:hypothetical protein
LRTASLAAATLFSAAFLASPAVKAGCLVSQPSVCSQTINADGMVGNTSYRSLPFASSIYAQSWGSSPDLAPTNLFWQYGQNFTNGSTMLAARQYANKLTGQGIVPASGAQRWEDTYEAARPAGLFPNEPSWIANDRWSQNLLNKPEFKAWVRWEDTRQNLFAVAADGGSMGTDFRSWKGNWGFIEPMMPLAASDWPPRIQNATYGDWYAYRWGQTAGASGAYGIMLSDFSDSAPGYPSYQMGFNSELIDRFAVYIGKQIPGGSIAQRATYINSHFMAQWNDFQSQGYANFFAALATRLGSATGRQPLVVDQCGQWPSARRFQGIDPYIINHSMPSANYICTWDNQTMQSGRSGLPMIWGIGGMVIAAAREPDIRNGGNLSADDSAFWQAVSQFWGNLSYNDQHERGIKELRRVWLETAWSHIATRQGTVRRAMAFMSRDYWDRGKLEPTLQRLVQTIIPTRPFGLAVYYSTAAERRVEAGIPRTGTNSSYMHPNLLFAFKNGGGAVGYYVGNAGLPALQPSARPAAWVVLDNRVPSSEIERLKQIAPVLTSLSAAKSFANAPLTFSSGLSGMGFFDQSNRLIVTASNLTANGINGTFTLRTLANGQYIAKDLFTGGTISFTVNNGSGWVTIPITRWDTRAFAITRS